MKIAGLVLVIVIGAGRIQAAIWIPLVRRWRRRSAAFLADLQTEITTSRERVVIDLEKANYRGGTGPYSAVKGNGMIILTDRRLIFRKLSGGVVEVSTQKIRGTRRSKAFRGSRVGGATHLVIATNDPAEVGFFVKDLDVWERALGVARDQGQTLS